MSEDCKRWRERLADRAAGAEPSAELAGHLQGCERCAATLARMRCRLGELDAALGDWMRECTPGDRFVDDIAAAVTTPSRPALAVWKYAAAAAAAVLLAALAGIVHLQRQATVTVPWEAAIEITSWSSPTDRLLADATGIPGTAPTFGDFYYSLENPTENRR